jgi:lysophospholipase L1-like esterase
MSRASLVFWFLAVVCGAAGISRGEEKREHDFARWEAAIRAFEEQDRENPPEAGGVLFVGSSTIRMWKTDELLPELDVTNRGFGGSEMIDSVHFVDRIVIPHQPQVILVYAGSNDLAKGTTPCQVNEDFKQFAETVHAKLPETEIAFLSIKPTLKRWPIIHRVRAANALVEATCIENERLHFLNVFPHMLNAEGQPEASYLARDGLHLNDAGYEHLTKLVRPELERLLRNGDSAK